MRLCSKHDFPVALHRPLQLSHELPFTVFWDAKLWPISHQWPLHQILQVFSPHQRCTTTRQMERSNTQWCVNLFLFVDVALSLGSKCSKVSSAKYRRSLVKGTGQNQITKKMHGQKWTCAAQRLHLCSLLNLQIVLTKTSLQHQLLQFVAPCCGSCNKRSISIDIPGD